MRQAFVLSISILILSMSLVSAAGNGGINESTDLENTGISSVSYDATFYWIDSDQDFTINVELDDNSNISSIKIWTQICVNSGLCHPPTPQDMVRDNTTGIWAASVDSMDDQTYVNWYFELVEGENVTRTPDNGWGWKVWSDCWFDAEKWGGVNEEDKLCGAPKTPAIGIVGTTISVLIAAAVIRRD